LFTDANDLLAAYERGERPRLTFANHALTRGVEMAEQLKLDPAEIRKAIETPERIQLSPKYQVMNLKHGRVCLAVDLDGRGNPIVTTILWARSSDWEASYEAGETEGRSRRFGTAA